MFEKKNTEIGQIYVSDMIPQIEHFFTTRTTNVDENRESICKYLKITDENLINPTQTHSSNVCYAEPRKVDYPNTDAIILNNFEQAVYLRFADCTPVIIYNKLKNIGAIAHAGWRGTADKIVIKTLNKMGTSKSDLDNTYAIIGPAIGICCYEVGQEVIDRLKITVKEHNNYIKNSHIDLKGINAQQLIENGVPESNIDICPFCTSCNNDLFFSYRKENGTLRRHNAVIKLRGRGEEKILGY